VLRLSLAHEFKDLLASLQYPSMTHRRDDIAEVHKETSRWVWKDKAIPGFVDWLRRSTGIFWIKGKACSGRSTLMRYILNEVETKSFAIKPQTMQSTLYTGFFFSSRGLPLLKSLSGLLRSVLYHVITRFPALVPAILPLDKNDKEVREGSEEECSVWSLRDLHTTFENLMTQSRVGGLVFLLIDGLDEYDGAPEDIGFH